MHASFAPFNEGRGFTPGDTRGAHALTAVVAQRSMRAGGSPPATPFQMRVCPLAGI